MDCIVIGTEHHNTLGVIRSLGESQIYPIVYLKQSNKNFVEKSKYIRKYIYFSEYKVLPTLLMQNALNDNQRRIIISCADTVSRVLDENKETLSRSYFLPGMYGRYLLKDVQDKLKMAEIARHINLVVPQTYSAPFNLSRISFPCISKPTNSTLAGKNLIKVFNDGKSLEAFVKEFKDDIFVQRYIEKDEEIQFIGCSLDGEKVIIPGMTKILRSSHNTNTGYLEYSAISPEYAQIHKKSIDFIRFFKYRGLFSVEFIKGKDGIFYFLEANFRNDGNAYVVTRSGVNLPALWIKFHENNENKDNIDIVRKIRFMPEFQDFSFVKNHSISFFKWICEFAGSEAHSVWNIKDMAPFYACIKHLMKRSLNLH